MTKWIRFPDSAGRGGVQYFYTSVLLLDMDIKKIKYKKLNFI